MYPAPCAGSTFIGTCFGVGVDLLERAGQRLAGAEQLGAAAVGLELADAGERHLQHRGGDRGEDHHGERAEDVAAAVTVAAARRRTSRPTSPCGPRT